MRLLSRLISLLQRMIQLPRMVYNRARIPYRILRYGHEGLYADIFHSTYKQVAAMQRALDDRQFERALDLGCGYGRMTPWIQEYCDSYEGVDPYTRFLNEARAQFPEASFTETHAGDLPFPDEHFDLVVAWNSLMYLDIDGLSGAAEEIRRVMLPGGTLVIRTDTGNGEQQGDRWYHPVEVYESAFSSFTLESEEVLGTTEPDTVYQPTILTFSNETEHL